MKKFYSLSLKNVCFLVCFLGGFFISGINNGSLYGQCDANSPNVEITITSIDILAPCDGDPSLDTSIEPTISIGGSVLTFSPSNSADGGALGASGIPGNYVVTNADLIDGCSSSTTIAIGAAGGSTMVPVPIEIWEEDGCGTCGFGTGTFCNDDADYVNLGSQMVDITQPTGSFATSCYVFNYSVDCPPPCDPTNCTNDVAITFTSVDASGCDGDITSELEAAILINGVVYEFSVNDAGNTVVSAANENCAGTATINFGTIAAGTSTIPLTGIEGWEEDGCGACSFGTGTFCNDDADQTTGGSHTIDLNAIGGSIPAGCFVFNYTTMCTSLCCLSAGAVAGTATCAGDNAIFNVSFNTSDTPTTYEVFDQTNGVVIGMGMSSPIATTVVGPTMAGTIDIIVRDQNDPTGCVTPPVTITLPDCPAPECIIPNGTWSK